MRDFSKDQQSALFDSIETSKNSKKINGKSKNTSSTLNGTKF